MNSKQILLADTTVLKDQGRQLPSTAGPPERSGQTDATTPAVPDDTDRLSKDVIFGLLSNERRRRILRYLAENGPGTTLSDLAEHIASNENNMPVAALTSKERKRVYICLYQTHLPKMDDAGVIDYNQPRGTVELKAEADQLFTYLDVGRTGSNGIGSWLQPLVPAPLLALWARYVEWDPVDLVRHR